MYWLSVSKKFILRSLIFSVSKLGSNKIELKTKHNQTFMGIIVVFGQLIMLEI